MASKLWVHEPDTFFLEAAREISEKRNLFFVNRSVPENLQLCFNILYLGIPVLFSHHSDMMLSTKNQSRHIRCSWRSLASTRIMTKARSQDGIVVIKCVVSERPPSTKISIIRIKHKLNEKSKSQKDIAITGQKWQWPMSVFNTVQTIFIGSRYCFCFLTTKSTGNRS